MGDVPSKDLSADGAEGISASELHRKFCAKKVEPDVAFQRAFVDDDSAQEGIKDIVRKLQDYEFDPASSGTKTANNTKAAERAEAAEERRTRSATRKAQAEAEKWLRNQVPRSKPGVAMDKGKKVPTRVDAGGTSISGRPQQSGRPSPGLHGRNPLEAEQCGPSRTKSFLSGSLSQPRSFVEYGAAPTRHGVVTGLPLPVQLAAPHSEEPYAPPPPASAPPMPRRVVPEPPVPEFYKLLGVNEDATFEEIKKGFRREALKWHPDKNRNQSDVATERFQRINAAFDTLFDPEKRSTYDSGHVGPARKAKKLQGYGWSVASDEDDSTLTPIGVKLKKLSWRGYLYFGGRIDDEEVIYDEKDPRYPQERVKVFWRFLGKKAYEARESGEQQWLKNFVSEIWRDTPTRWPAAIELQKMSNTSQQEWKERRMVNSRRRHKVRLYVDLHEEYLETSDLEEKQKERLRKIWPDCIVP